MYVCIYVCMYVCITHTCFIHSIYSAYMESVCLSTWSFVCGYEFVTHIWNSYAYRLGASQDEGGRILTCMELPYVNRLETSEMCIDLELRIRRCDRYTVCIIHPICLWSFYMSLERMIHAICLWSFLPIHLQLLPIELQKIA